MWLILNVHILMADIFEFLLNCPGIKPLSKPMLEYCYLDFWEQTSVKF